MKSKKWWIGSAVLGMVITGSAGVYAGSNLEQIKAYLNHKIAIEVNGSAFSPVDGKGNKQAPITYNGYTYLPVRSIADALDVPVTFDTGTNKVVIGSSSSTGSIGNDYTGIRPKYLPKDFPIPKGAVITDTVESSNANGKSVYFEYETQNGLESLGNVYKAYFRTLSLDNTTEEASSTSLTMVGSKSGSVEMSILGNPKRDKNGYYEISVTWSGK